MAHKKLLGFWAFFDVCLLAAALISIILSIVWRGHDPLRNLVIDDEDYIGGLILGSFFLLTFVVSIGAIVQPNHVTLPLVALNWLLLVDGVVITVVGVTVWWMTLEERNNFSARFDAASTESRLAIQNKLSCCGYWFNNQTSVIVNQGFCQTANNATACVGPVTNFADTTLNDIFTSVFGFGAVVACLFLATVCVIKVRMEDERFKKIDAKRGGRGFV